MVFVQKQECVDHTKKEWVLIFEVLDTDIKVRVSKKYLLTSENFS